MQEHHGGPGVGPGGVGSIPAVGETFMLGVNYWPRRKAMYWWSDFDSGEVRDEFALIADLGLTHVRIFLLWESFQPERDRISPQALADLRTVCDLAAETGLQVQITFFTGHMSGPNWAPAWLLDRDHPRRPGERQIVGLTEPAGAVHPIHDVYTTPFVVEAEDRLLRAVCAELADHPAVWGWSLGNEPDLFCQPVDAQAAASWVRSRTATIRSVDPRRPVLIGLHSRDIEADVGFRVPEIAAETDISVMHGYSIYSRHARSALDADFVPFTAALTAALAGRPILYEELGVNTHWPDGPSHWEELALPEGRSLHAYFASEDDAATYIEAVLPRLVRVGSLGAFVWCFADYAPSLWGLPPCDFQVHERFFGLVRPDGSLKPSAEVLRRFARSRPLVRSPEPDATVSVTADEYYRDPERSIAELYERFGHLG